MASHAGGKTSWHWPVVSSFLPLENILVLVREEVVLLCARLEAFLITQLQLACFCVHLCAYIHIWLISSFLGAFAKLRKAAISFVMSVRLSARVEQLGSHWMDFHEIWYLIIFRKYVEKIQVSFKSDNNKWYFT